MQHSNYVYAYDPQTYHKQCARRQPSASCPVAESLAPGDVDASPIGSDFAPPRHVQHHLFIQPEELPHPDTVTSDELRRKRKAYMLAVSRSVRCRVQASLPASDDGGAASTSHTIARPSNNHPYHAA